MMNVLFLSIYIFFSIKMIVENVKVCMKTVHIAFPFSDNRPRYHVTFICKNTEKNHDCGCITFVSDDGAKWSCIDRDRELCNFKLDHIFTDSNIPKLVSEVISKLVLEK